jgi:hypothetical protein
MGLKQLSVFLENSPGRLFEVTKAFGEAGINLKALSLVDTAGFGVLRLLVSDLPKARKIAMERHWPAKVEDVIAARIPDLPGSLADVLGPLNEANINVEYMYAFTGFSRDEAVMIFRFRRHEEAVAAFGDIGVNLLAPEEFGLLEGEEGS